MLYEMLTGKMPFSGPNPFADHERPAAEQSDSAARNRSHRSRPQLQEIIYRAMERDPENRYPTAREFIRDLEHQDQVGVADRAELRDWKVRKTGTLRTILKYVGLILDPVVVFTLAAVGGAQGLVIRRAPRLKVK